MIFQLRQLKITESLEKKKFIKIYNILLSSAAWLKGGECVIYILEYSFAH